MSSITSARSRWRLRPLARHVVAVALLSAVIACGDTQATSPTSRGRIAISSGNAQRGSPGQPLGEPITLVVRNTAGDPLPGIRVNWFADDGGTMSPSESTTDDDGSASATWTLGASPPHHGHAVADGYDGAEFTASSDELPLDVIQPLNFKTYDGSGQVVHPDYVATGSGRFLFITPYPNGNANFENPSIFAGGAPLEWTVPAGATNPLVAPQEGYDSDPDAVYVGERDEIWLYFRQVTSENTVRLTKSGDGVHWTTPTVVAHAPNHQIISPTVVRRAPNEWLMWAVNGNVGCTGTSTTVELRRSTNGIDWSNPQTVALTQGDVSPWHIDVEWIPSRGEFWALFNGKTSGTCTTGAVYLATSTDGAHWTTYPSPVLSHGAIPELQDVVYRSSFAYDEWSDAITIWYSGARYDGRNYVWRSAVQRRLRAALFATINAPARAAALADRSGLPELLNFP